MKRLLDILEEYDQRLHDRINDLEEENADLHKRYNELLDTTLQGVRQNETMMLKAIMAGAFDKKPEEIKS